jgi:hypothetical protein
LTLSTFPCLVSCLPSLVLVGSLGGSSGGVTFWTLAPFFHALLQLHCVLTLSNPLPPEGRGVNLLCPMLRGACGSGRTPILFRALSFDCWGGSRIVVNFSQHS